VEAQQARDQITRLVERTTGFPARVAEDSSLPTLGTVKMARPSLPYHLIRYSPAARDTLDYIVSFQCGFVIRLAGVPLEKRYEIGASPRGAVEVAELVRLQFGTKEPIRLPEMKQPAFSAQLLGGLITQLRSIPLALRIDDWLRNQFAGLRDQQDESCRCQLREGIAALDPRVRRAVPKQIAEASVAMNAAQAMYWAEAWEDEQAIAPYKAAGLLDEGRKLLRLWKETPGDPTHDRELIDAWGRHLGIEGWYAFVPFGQGAE